MVGPSVMTSKPETYRTFVRALYLCARLCITLSPGLRSCVSCLIGLASEKGESYDQA